MGFFSKHLCECHSSQEPAANEQGLAEPEIYEQVLECGFEPSSADSARRGVSHVAGGRAAGADAGWSHLASVPTAGQVRGVTVDARHTLDS